MDIEGLKDKILQLAMQGKLVKQDPNDEPASLLLERIKKERKKLIKEKKMRRSKKLPLIEEDEEPFKVPENWELVRLGEIIRIYSGKGLTSRNMISEGEIPVYGGNGITGYHNDYNIEKPTIVIGRVGFYCGSIHLTSEKSWVTDNAFITEYSEDNICQKFLKRLLEGTDLRKNDSATAQPVISGGKVYPIVVGLPPLKEQKRIVEKIDLLFAIVDELDSDKEGLLKIINLTRNQVLQEAIQGKLVEQNPEDEPSSILLEKIKKEKDKLIKERKIRKEKKLAIITEEEKTFDLPNGWEWVRLGEIINLISGRDLPVTDCNDEGVGIPYIMGASNIYEEKLLIERWIEQPKVISQKDDLLLTVKGTVGKIMLLKEYDEVNLSRQLMAIRQVYNEFPNYLYYFLKSHVNKIIEKSQGVIPGISRDDILTIVYPLPPIEEQKLISEKVEAIMKKLDELENELITKN